MPIPTYNKKNVQNLRGCQLPDLFSTLFLNKQYHATRWHFYLQMRMAYLGYDIDTVTFHIFLYLTVNGMPLTIG